MGALGNVFWFALQQGRLFKEYCASDSIFPVNVRELKPLASLKSSGLSRGQRDKSTPTSSRWLQKKPARKRASVSSDAVVKLPHPSAF